MIDLSKKAAGRAAAALLRDGMIVGLGSGSTANAFHKAVAERIQQEGLRVQGVAPSIRTQEHCAALGIPVIRLTRGLSLDLAVDGADEIGPGLALIKGGGGALVREKLVVAAAQDFVVVGDATKRVALLGTFPLPVAIIPFGWEQTVERLEQTFSVPVLVRGGWEVPQTSDDGLFIADMHFDQILDPAEVDARLHRMVGVVETGLFVGLATRALLGNQDGSVEEIRE